MFITLGMILLGYFFNKFMGLTPEFAKELRKKAKNLQERMKLAETMGDPAQIRQLQKESVDSTKLIMKKQFLPTCLRCVLFLSIFAVIGLIYAQYSTGLLPFPILFFGNGWVAVYFLFSITFSLIFYAVRKLYLKLTGKADFKKKESNEIMEMLSSSSHPFQAGQSESIEKSSNMIDSSDANIRKDSWKERIKN